MRRSTHLTKGGGSGRRRRLAGPLALVLLAEASLIAAVATPAGATPAEATRAGATPAGAVPVTPSASSPSVSEEAAARLTAAAQDRRVEVIGARTENTTLWANPEGTMSLETHAGPVRFRKGGDWVPVDTTLVRNADGSVGPKGHPRGLKLAGRTGAKGGALVTLGSGDRTVALGWQGALPQPQLKDNKVDVLPGTDLVVEATRTGFEQFLVVKDRAAAERAATFSLPLRARA